MARPQKEGLDYFPLDCGFFRDKKTRLVKAKFGAKGLVVLIQVFCEIYENHGYYMTWDEDDCLMMAETVGCGASPELVSQVIEFSAARSLFDYTLFSQEQILTSRGIQKRFIKSASKRDNIRMRKDLFLLDEKEIPKGSLVKLDLFSVSGEKTHVSGPETSVTGESIPKAKESKVKQSRVKNTYTSDSADVVGADAPHFDYQLYVDYWNHHVAEPTGIASVRKAAHWSSARKKNLRARVKAEGAKTVLAVFDMVSASDWLSGRSGNWQADFDWVIKPANFQKIIEGKYKNRQQADHETFYDRLARGEI